MTRDDIAVDGSKVSFIKVPERSEWKCYLFGNTPEVNSGMLYIPQKGCEPNWFVRYMMKICFACTWVKDERR